MTPFSEICVPNPAFHSARINQGLDCSPDDGVSRDQSIKGAHATMPSQTLPNTVDQGFTFS